ncbi:MAG TPA: hypothetical protein VOB72_19125 [Candidatus Dormibacteraeota bacterium]|nr:hypothetical protein [Candidatus Dormibacteraeota bacterium]
MRFIDFIRDRARYYNCPHCGRGLRDCELRMLRHVEDRYTIQVTCAACRVQFVLILAVQGEGLESLPAEESSLERGLAEDADLLGDAMRAEAAGATAPAEPAPEPIGSDELLDVHLALRDFQGPLTDLFRQPSGDRS